MSASDFCIRCDGGLSLYCGKCVDALRDENDDLRKKIANAPCLAARDGEMTYECRADNLCRVCRWRTEK